MRCVDADRSFGGPKPFHAAYQDGLARTFQACHAPMPARMQELLSQLGEAMLERRREQALGDASALAQYYAGPLPRRGRGRG
jgi:hypothetical protein